MEKKLMIRNFWAALFLVPFGLHEKHINFPGKRSTYTRKNLSLFMGTYQHLNFLAVFMPEYTT